MADKLKTTVRIQRPAKVQMDDRGRSVWVETVRTAEFDLLSTLGLNKILESKDETAIKAIEVAAESGDEGILARDVATGHYQILNDTDLQAILDSNFSIPKQKRGADVTYEPAYDSEKSIDELTFVSTQLLRKILLEEEKKAPVAVDIEESGFDPYNNS